MGYSPAAREPNFLTRVEIPRPNAPDVSFRRVSVEVKIFFPDYATAEPSFVNAWEARKLSHARYAIEEKMLLAAAVTEALGQVAAQIARQYGRDVIDRQMPRAASAPLRWLPKSRVEQLRQFRPDSRPLRERIVEWMKRK